MRALSLLPPAPLKLTLILLLSFIIFMYLYKLNAFFFFLMIASLEFIFLTDSLVHMLFCIVLMVFNVS